MGKQKSKIKVTRRTFVKGAWANASQEPHRRRQRNASITMRRFFTPFSANASLNSSESVHLAHQVFLGLNLDLARSYKSTELILNQHRQFESKYDVQGSKNRQGRLLSPYRTHNSW